MKNIEVINLHNEIINNNEIKKLKGIKLSLLLLENIEIIGNFIKKIEKSVQQSDDYKEYEKKRVSLCEEYAEKGEDSKPKTIKKDGNTEYVINVTDEFNKKMKKLNESYNDAILEQVEKIDEYNKFILEDCELDLKKIDSKLLPEDVSFEVIKILKPILETK